MTEKTPGQAAREAFISACIKRGITASQVLADPAGDAVGVWTETALAARQAEPSGVAATRAEMRAERDEARAVVRDHAPAIRRALEFAAANAGTDEHAAAYTSAIAAIERAGLEG